MARTKNKSRSDYNASSYDIRGRIVVTNEPNWLRLTLWIGLLAFYLTLAYLLTKFVPPACQGAPLISYLVPAIAFQGLRQLGRILGIVDHKRKST